MGPLVLRPAGTVPGMDTRLVFRAGPVVFSQRVGGQPGQVQELFHPAPLERVLAELRAHGWKVTGQQDGTALVAKGWTALQVQQVRGGVLARRVTSRRTVLAWTIGLAVLIGLFALCVGRS